ncbi:hypothetical protein Clacol_002269 [Clathrus columnatus]|uniref:NADH:flavin oxidoreductase/NADH oxidase N-terminal domain-containing protein n=1 Tax=Clathrus columnatus TaxID=1419009 RepID=A0AAV5A367_9AGAM|nr:hypothetical protein Clacol_002269 [Clathrus columnatus]
MSNQPPFLNPRVPGVRQFYPLNEPAIGSAYPKEVSPKNKTIPPLFQPITIRGETFKNRIFVAAMCQYSSDNGHATDWHLVHIGSFATRGAGAICMEATAVVPEGRISPEDAGLWTDTQIPQLKRIVEFVHTQGAKIGIQLAHAGRKASTLAPWLRGNLARTTNAGRDVAYEDENGWPEDVWGPSAISFAPGYPMPKELTEEKMDYVEKAFIDSVERCKQIGCTSKLIHAAHGYLLSEFLSPLSNKRTDKWGGQSLENRMRYPLRVIKSIREAWADKPLFVRFNAVEWAEGPEKEGDEWKQWGIEQSSIFTGELIKLGVDLIDVSSGGNWGAQKIPVVPGYQVPFAARLKKDHPSLTVGAVGLITDPKQANSIIEEGKADVVFLARELLRRIDFPLIAAYELGVAVKPANQEVKESWIYR